MKNNKIVKYLSKIHSGAMGNFLGTFYATVIGVFISLLCAQYIGEYNDRKNMAQALSAMKAELIENQAAAQELYERIRLEKTAMRYLQKNWDHLDSIPEDSLKLYGRAALTRYHVYFKFDALESMKMSGLFHKLPQKDLTLTISRAYTSIETMQKYFEEYAQAKESHINEIKKYKAVRNLPAFANHENWKIFTRYSEAYYYVKELPLLQASEHYRKRMKDIKVAIEALD